MDGWDQSSHNDSEMAYHDYGRQARSPPHHSRALLAQQEIWKLEQHIVGSLVQLEADPKIDTTIIAENPVFHLVKDDHLDIFSFSSKPELYGGVKVTFSDQQPWSEEEQQHHSRQDGQQQQNNKQRHSGENGDNHAVAVYVVVDRRTMDVVYHDYVLFVPRVPLVEDFRSFREVDKLEALVKKQKQERPELTPTAIIVNGHGLWHVRRAGIACFLGQRTDIPTVGVGTSTALPDAGWSSELVDTTIDGFLSEFHATVGQHHQTLAPTLSRYRGLILKKGVAHPNRSLIQPGNGQPATSSTAPSPATSAQSHRIDRSSLLRDLAPYCNGIGILLGDTTNGNGHLTASPDPSSSQISTSIFSSISSKFSTIGCALIGQGGQIAVSERAEPIAGATNPLLVSVGHAISLQRSVQICASLSVSSDVPEPLQQAAILGRSVLFTHKQRRQRGRGGSRRSTM